MLTGVAFHTDAVIGKNRYDAMKLAIEIRENEEEEYVGKFLANNLKTVSIWHAKGCPIHDMHCSIYYASGKSL